MGMAYLIKTIRLRAVCLSLGCMLVIAVATVGAASRAMALETVRVADNVFALVGPLEQRNPENLGNNATFGVVVTSAGVVLIDPGGSAAGGAVIDRAIAQITDQKVRVVINTGGQDHRWFANAYFMKKGATVIASAAAVEDQKERTNAEWQAMETMIGPANLEGTELRHADTTFKTRHILELGGRRLEIIHAGAAHTPGDSFVWLADAEVVFAGDIVYLDRLLGVGEQSNTRSWLEVFAAIEKLGPRIVVPGHGRPGTLAKAEAETRDYLRNLRAKIGALIEAGGDMIAAVKIDQSAFRHLVVFDQLAGRNAQAVFAEMEFE